MNEPLIESMRKLETFDGLSDDDLTVLAGRASVRELPPRTVLFNHGENDTWIHCLTEGTLELVATDGRSRRIEGGTPAAGYPIAALRPRQYTAITLTPAQLISIDGADIGNWHEVLMNSAFEVTELDEPGGIDVEEDEEPDGCERILSAGLEMPSLPTVALQAQRTIDRDDGSIDQLARIVVNDPSITAKLVKAANSPVFYGCGNVETCERAIVRLGLKTTRQLVIAFAMRDLFKCESPRMHERMQTLWEHSSEVATIAYVMAKMLKVCDPAEAQLAGLVHDIGGVPVLSYAATVPELADDPDAVDELDNSLRSSLGPRLLRSWNFSEALVNAAREAEHWHRVGNAKADLTDVVIVAQLVSHFGKPSALAMPPLRQVPAFRKLFGKEAGPEEIMTLLDEAQEEIDQLKGLLRN